ncbi:MAG: hypothetical protein LBC19_11975 [Tannerella sp.]|jgi:hypothetical protein|nr:hypothetical protein [Tannerella sp.]
MMIMPIMSANLQKNKRISIACPLSKKHADILINIMGDGGKSIFLSQLECYFSLYSKTGKKYRSLPQRRRGRFVYAQSWPLPRTDRSRPTPGRLWKIAPCATQGTNEVCKPTTKSMRTGIKMNGRRRQQNERPATALK